jgi:MauM/NapG family ferredoxin protein
VGCSILGPGAAAAPAWNLTGSPLRVDRLRPPGAVAEDRFTGHCIRCGRCMEVCPYRCILPLDVREGVHAGTPVIDVRDVPCYLCMKCPDVCPTGALKPLPLEETRMGLAVIDKEACVAWNGTALCRTCYSVCPLQNEAIVYEEMLPRVVEDGCTGCGICVNACPVSAEDGRRAIFVEPPR